MYLSTVLLIRYRVADGFNIPNDISVAKYKVGSAAFLWFVWNKKVVFIMEVFKGKYPVAIKTMVTLQWSEPCT